MEKSIKRFVAKMDKLQKKNDGSLSGGFPATARCVLK